MNAAHPLPVESALVRALLAGEFAVTAEVVPPLSSDPVELLEKAAPTRGCVDALNVTDGAGARPHLASLAAAGILVQNGYEPVLQFTCRDRNRLALQSDLLGAGAFGIQNLLILGGDDPKAGDQPDTKPVFDLGPVEFHPDGAADARRCRPAVGSRDLPSAEPVHRHRGFPDGTQSRLDAGPPGREGRGRCTVCAAVLLDIGVLERYIARLRDHGIQTGYSCFLESGPLLSAKSARWMRENLWGVIIPDELIERMEGAEDERAEGRKICVELIQQMREIEGIAGVHIMAIRQQEAIPEIVAQAQIGPAHRRAGLS